MVGTEGALGAGVGGNCSNGMDGSKTITRRYPGRGSVYCSGGFRYLVGRLYKRKRGGIYIYIRRNFALVVSIVEPTQLPTHTPTHPLACPSIVFELQPNPTQPNPTNPTQSKQTKPTKNNQTKPSLAKPNQNNPNQTKPNQTKPNQTKPNQTKPNQTKPNQTKPNQNKPKQTKTNQTRPNQTKPNQTKPNQTKPNQTKPNQTKPNQTKPNQTKPNQTRPNQTKPNQTKPNQTKPNQTKPKQTKPNQTPIPNDNKRIFCQGIVLGVDLVDEENADRILGSENETKDKDDGRSNLKLDAKSEDEEELPSWQDRSAVPELFG